MEPKAFYYPSMGTTWKISIWDDISEDLFEKIKSQILEDSQNFDNTYSRFISTSLVSKIAERAGVWRVPEDFMVMLNWYIKLYNITNGKLNPLIGFTISDLGYDADYSLTEREVIRQTPDLMSVIKVIDKHTIQTFEPVLFDFGALGKGYFVDKISEYLRNSGIKRFLVDGSGDIYYEGNGETIKVGLEHPDDSAKVIGVFDIKKGSVCASGINRRVWGKNNHVIDPKENRSVNGGIISSWVFAQSAVLADALATCLFLVSPEKIQKDYNFEYLLLNKEHMIKHSSNFKAEFFS